MNNIIRSTIYGACIVAGVMAAGCTTPPENADAQAAIDSATQDVNRAAADPQAAKYGQDEIGRAQDSLKTAQTTWDERSDVGSNRDARKAKSYAYIASQQAATAIELGKTGAADNAIKVSAAERNDLVKTAYTQAAERGITMRFAVDDSKLPATSKQGLDRFAAVLKHYPDRKVVIDGHTDSTGSKGHNMALAKERAESVRTALVNDGIDPNRIEIRGFGPSAPVASNATSEGRQENRRADVAMLDAQGNLAAGPLTGIPTSVGSSGTRGSSKAGSK